MADGYIQWWLPVPPPSLIRVNSQRWWISLVLMKPLLWVVTADNRKWLRFPCQRLDGIASGRKATFAIELPITAPSSNWMAVWAFLASIWLCRTFRHLNVWFQKNWIWVVHRPRQHFWGGRRYQNADVCWCKGEGASGMLTSALSSHKLGPIWV